ncbi:MAG TPA: hypothetical protein VI669_08145 [Vicinamibacteria bacterium]
MKTFLFLLLATSALADDMKDARERVLRQFFEGRSVTVYIDMPASSKGIDLSIGQPEPLEAGKHARRLVETGVSVREGTRILITRINLKDDLIEFHLGGGGFNPIWNGSGTVSPTYGKTSREKRLEDEVRRERDPRRRRELERDLDRERDRRRRDEQRSREIADATNEIRRERDRDRALAMGSRFNLRFEKAVPAGAATPDGVMELLSPFVDFSGLPGGEVYSRRRPEDPNPDGPDDREEAAGLRAGMSRSEVGNLLGPAEREDSRTEGDLHKAVAIFRDGGRRMELIFVNGILVQFKELR